MITVLAAIIAWAKRPSAELRRIERKLDTLLACHRPSESMPPCVSDEVARLARAGRKIEALKLHRQKTGLGLAEAKADVEEIARHKSTLAE